MCSALAPHRPAAAAVVGIVDRLSALRKNEETLSETSSNSNNSRSKPSLLQRILKRGDSQNHQHHSSPRPSVKSTSAAASHLALLSRYDEFKFKQDALLEQLIQVEKDSSLTRRDTSAQASKKVLSLRKRITDLHQELVALGSILARIRAEDDKYIQSLRDPNGACIQIRKNLAQTHARRFEETARRVKATREAVFSLSTGLLEDESERPPVMPIPDPTYVLISMQDNGKRISAREEQTVDQVEQRAEAILNLESTVEQIAHLTKDLACMIDYQEEVLQNIEQRIERTKSFNEHGNQALKKAAHEQARWSLF